MAFYLYSKLSSYFQEKEGSASTKVGLNGGVANGSSSIFSKRRTDDIPIVEITDSPSSLPRRMKKAASIGSVSGLSEDSRSPDEARPSSAGSKASGRAEETDSPTQSLTTESVMSPSRKSTDALKKVSSLLMCMWRGCCN